MSEKMHATHVTLWVTRFIMAFVLLAMPCLPFFLNWYYAQSPLSVQGYNAILIAFYCCVVFVLLALWSMDGLLRNILAGEVFVFDNVRFLRRIRWCCALISLICLPASFFYVPLWIMVIIMAFLSLVVCVVVQVMKAAVAIREENDLTI